VRAKPVTLDAGEVAAVRQMLVTKAHDDPEFWCVVGLSELALYEAAASQQLHAQQAEITAGYEALHLRTRGSGNWGSAADQLDFVLYGIVQHGPKAEREAAEALIALVRGYAAG